MAEIAVTFDSGSDYERFMGRWSRAIGERFLDWLAPPPNVRWLDIGCGTGAFSQLVLKHCSPTSVAGIDPAPAQIELACRQTPQVDFRVADATALPFMDDKFDIVASALVINFIPDRTTAFSEMHRVLRRGGIVTAYLWDRTATTDFSPHAPMERGLHAIGAEALRPPISPEATPEGAKGALERGGFHDIDITGIDAIQTYRDFEDYWGAQTVSFAPIGKSVAALSDDKRALLRETMKSMLPPNADGSISYSARALAFKASKPS